MLEKNIRELEQTTPAEQTGGSGTSGTRGGDSPVIDPSASAGTKITEGVVVTEAMVEKLADWFFPDDWREESVAHKIKEDCRDALQDVLAAAQEPRK